MSTETQPAPAGPGEQPPRDTFTLFLVVACIALAVLVIVLARQNRQLKMGMGAVSAPQMPPDALKTGDRVEPFVLVGEAGRKDRLEFTPNGPKTLLLVFSSHCPACEKTLPVWGEFLASAKPSGFRTIGIETDRPGDAPDVSGIVPAAMGFPIFSVENPEPPVMRKLPYIPATVLLDGNGLVVRVWFGIPSKEQLDELRDLVSA